MLIQKCVYVCVYIMLLIYSCPTICSFLWNHTYEHICGHATSKYTPSQSRIWTYATTHAHNHVYVRFTHIIFEPTRVMATISLGVLHHADSFPTLTTTCYRSPSVANGYYIQRHRSHKMFPRFPIILFCTTPKWPAVQNWWVNFSQPQPLVSMPTCHTIEGYKIKKKFTMFI